MLPLIVYLSLNLLNYPTFNKNTYFSDENSNTNILKF